MRIYNKSLGEKPILTTSTTQYYQGGYKMNELQLAFKYEAAPVRTITDGVTIWFALIDVCKIFDLSNPRMVAKSLDDDEVRKFNLRRLEGDTWFITESGLYTVIIRSRSNKAKPFRRWVTHEVLPSIRKQGYYSFISDDELVNVITEKQRRNKDFLSKIDKTAIKSLLLKEARESRDEDTRLLFLQQSELSCREFWTKLKSIWKDDMPRFHRYLDKYQKWYNKIGYRVVPNER